MNPKNLLPRKISLRIICLILAVLLLLPLTACAVENGSENDGSSAVSDGDTTTDHSESVTDAVTVVKDDIPDTLKFGETINILCWNNEEDFVISRDNALSIVDSAIYDRNITVEERLDVELKWTSIPGSWPNKTDYVNTAYNDVLAGGTFDIFSGYSLTGAMMAVKGITQNILSYDVINLDKPWWPSTLIETNSVAGKVYFISGDISASMLYSMFCLFLNKNLFTTTHPGETIDDVYAIVDSGEWTLDEFFKLCQNVCFDNNTNGIPDLGDEFGFIAQDPSMDSFYIASGLDFLETDNEGLIIVSEDVRSEKTLKLLQQLDSFCRSSGDALLVSTAVNGNGARDTFNSSNAMLTVDSVSYAKTLQEVADFSYGIIPMPKYDAGQAEYATCIDFGYSVYSISQKSKNSDAAATVIECMASESYNNVTPAIFEITMKHRYADAPDDARMFDIIRNSVVFERGRSFAMQFDTKTFGLFRLALRDQTVGTWTSSINSNWRILQSYAKTVNKQFESFDD